MTDFEYEVRERKKLAAQARYRKRGNKTKYVSLPSDHMTMAEWKRRNGNVMTYTLGKPMTWDDFKPMPEYLQKEYLQKLKRQFNATNAVIGNMLGVSDETVRKLVNGYGLNTQTVMGKTYNTGTRMTPVEKDRWQAWISGGVSLPAETESAAPAETEIETKTPEPTEPAETAETAETVEPVATYDVAPPCSIISGSMTYTGKAAEILNNLRQLLGNQRVTLTVEFRVNEN